MGIDSILSASPVWPCRSPPSVASSPLMPPLPSVVHEIVERKLPAPVILDPLLRDLVAAHVKLPDLFGYTLEVLGIIARHQDNL
jgi:hypothetical protein